MTKDKTVKIRLSEDEYLTLKQAAADSGLKMSEYLRLGIGEKREAIVIPEEINKLLYELNHVGINLNQLVVVARVKNYPEAEIKTCLRDLDDLRMKIFNLIMKQ